MADATGVIAEDSATDDDWSGGKSTLGPLVRRYLRERKQRGEITQVTVETIGRALWTFARLFGRRPLTQLGPAALDRWLESIAHMADSTRRGRLSAVKGFSRWLVANRIIERDFTLTAPRIRVARRVPRDLTLDHFEAILDVCDDERERLCVWLVFGAGLRCIEIHRLDVRDYDPYSQLLHVRGKAMHERVVPVVPPVRSAIEAYLSAHPAATGPLVRRTDYFSYLAPSPSRISHLIGDLIRRSGVKLRLHDGRSAHGLRAAAASELYDACRDPRIVQEFLGHQHLQTTTIYLRRAGTEAVREALNLRSFETAR